MGQPDTPWINELGARRILRETGILPDPHPAFAHDIAGRDRKTYAWGVLMEFALALAEKSANPAALVPEGNRYEPLPSPLEAAIGTWASECARSLEEVLVSAQATL